MKRVGKSSKKGFTLVELIVVLVILAILAAMLVPALTGYIKRAKQEKDYQAASVVYAAAQAAITDAYGHNATITSPLTQTTRTYGPEVYDLAGVDSAVVTGFSFAFGDDMIIDSGNVTIKNGSTSYTYYLHTDGTWHMRP